MPSRPEKTANVASDPEVWVDAYGSTLYRMAYAMVSDPAIAEELVQETFVGALRSRKNFQKRSSERTWLIAILKHKIVDYFRAQSKRQHLEFKDEIATDATEASFESEGQKAMKPSKWAADPTKLYHQKEFFEVLYRCLSELSPRLAEAFMLREFQGFDTEELCKELDISATNSWVMLHRARVSLRGCLEKNWFNIEVPVS